MNKGFTLIELIITIAIIAILSGIVLFGIIQYVNKGKDSNVYGNLAILVPAGEVFYNRANNYENFCSSDVVTNAIGQMPDQTSNAPCYNGTTKKAVCCYVEATQKQSWAACARKFATPADYYCVDSRGVKKEVTGACSQASLMQGSSARCP